MVAAVVVVDVVVLGIGGIYILAGAVTSESRQRTGRLCSIIQRLQRNEIVLLALMYQCYRRKKIQRRAVHAGRIQTSQRGKKKRQTHINTASISNKTVVANCTKWMVSGSPRGSEKHIIRR